MAVGFGLGSAFHPSLLLTLVPCGGTSPWGKVLLRMQSWREGMRPMDFLPAGAFMFSVKSLGQTQAALQPQQQRFAEGCC